VQSALAGSGQAASQGPGLITYVIYAITILAGFSGFLILSLLIGAETILWSIIQFASSPSTSAAGAIANQAGVAPIIPGIDIPLFAGVISIAVLLIIHEFSHGILAKRAKVKLKEIGLLVFGFIPIGGYVEPDEKMVEKLDRTKQTKIFSAGVAANFIATIVFFLLMLAFMMYLFPAMQINYHYNVVVASTVPNYPANGVLKSGMKILEWNNVSMTNLSTQSSVSAALNAAKATDRPNATVSIVTNTGSYKFKAIPSTSNSSIGLIGISIGTEYTPVINGWYAHAAYFLFTIFALSMLLNFFVGILNLAPIPGFDGWRIYGANIKSQKFINFVGALIIILIIVNVLPWFFYI
jgi:membrane-associated protease RseP (regulator of RpoE activity)